MKLNNFWMSLVLMCVSYSAIALEPAPTTHEASSIEGVHVTCGQVYGKLAFEKAGKNKNHLEFPLIIESVAIKGKAGFSRFSCSLLLPLQFPKPKILTQVGLRISFEQQTPQNERNSLSQLKFMANLFEGMVKSGKEEGLGEWLWTETSSEKSVEEVFVILKTLKKCSKEHRLRSNFSALIQGKPALAFDAYNRGLRNTQVSLKVDEKTSAIGKLTVDTKDCVE